MKSSIIPAAVVALVAIPSVASAQDQPWLKDRRYTEGIGYKVGDFELHPGAAVEVGYDSNYTHSCGSSCTPEQDVVGTMRLRLTPSLSIETLGQQRRDQAGGSPPSIEFRARVAAVGDVFFGVSGASKAQGTNLSNIGIVSDMGLQILPGHTWSGNVIASYNRALTPTESLPTGGAFNSNGTFNRDLPTVGGELVFTPGAGLFEARLGYLFSGTFFEDGTHFQQLDNVNNQVELRGRWRFLPRTALVYDGRFSFINYTSSAPAMGANAAPVHSNAHPVRSELGINGLVTPSFGILAMGGWGSSFYAPSPGDMKLHNFDSFIGQLELKWYVTPNPSTEPGNATLTLSAIAVGFLRDFSDSFIGSYFERDRGYVNLSYNFAGRFIFVLEGGGAAIVYPVIPVISPSSGFTDAHIDASLFGEWRFKDSFGLNATVRYNQEISSQPLMALGQTTSLAYKEVEAFLGFRWLM